MGVVEAALVERAVAQARLDLGREPGRRGIVEHVGQGLEHHTGGVDGAAHQQVAPDSDLRRHDLGAVREPPADLLGDREILEHLGIAVPEEGARADGALRPDHELGQVALVALGHRRRQLQRTVEQVAGLGVAGRRLRGLGRDDVGRDGLCDVAGQVPVLGHDGEIARVRPRRRRAAPRCCDGSPGGPAAPASRTRRRAGGRAGSGTVPSRISATGSMSAASSRRTSASSTGRPASWRSGSSSNSAPRVAASCATRRSMPGVAQARREDLVDARAEAPHRGAR